MSINQNIDSLVLKLQRRDLIGSRQTALETAQLLLRFVAQAKFSSIEVLIEQIKTVGRRLVAANPKELAIGNIVRKVLRLIREEYKAAYAAHIQSQGLPTSDSDAFDYPATGIEPQTPGTPMPPTPGIHVPTDHYLSDEYRKDHFKAFDGPGASSSPFFLQESGSTSTSSSVGPSSPLSKRMERPAELVHSDTSLSNFVQMRHSRAQLERAGSSVSIQDLEYGAKRLGLDGVRFPSETNIQRSSRDGDTPSILPARQQSFPGHARSAGSPLTAVSPPPTSTSAANSQDSAMAVAHARESYLQSRDAFQKKAMQMKPVLVDAIREVLDELEMTHEACAKGAREHIHSSEIILTVGMSRTVLAFLKAAWKDRKFTVIVAETSPSQQGHHMAESLSKLNIPTILVPDSSIYALMPRITKVLIGAHSVLANGGVFTVSGSLLTAFAAKAHSTPVVIVSGQFKFAPAWNLYHDYSSADFRGPGEVLKYTEGDSLDRVEVSNPFYDYIRPDLINLFITNEGDHSPVTAYRIIKDAYDDEDASL